MIGGSGLWVDLVSPEAGFGEQAVAHGIGKPAHVSGSSEDGLMIEDGAVHPQNIVTFLDVFTPPVVLEVSLQLGTERAVVPATVETAVEFGGLEDETFAFAQGDDGLHAVGISVLFIGHGSEKLRGREETGERPRGKGFFGELRDSKNGELFFQWETPPFRIVKTMKGLLVGFSVVAAYFALQLVVLPAMGIDT